MPSCKVGHVYIAGEGGQNSLVGSKFAAQKLGLEIVGQEISPTATDVTAQVSAMKAAGVKAVLLTGVPRVAHAPRRMLTPRETHG